MRTPQEIVIDRALGSWLTRVLDPPKGAKGPDVERGLAAIQSYLAALGVATPYTGDNDKSWCGAHAAWCWEGAGMTLALGSKFAGTDVPGHCLGSTYRLAAAAKRDPLFKVQSISDIRPSDIVVVDGPEHKRYGDHITTALAWDKPIARLTCVHGNGHGRWPTGEWVEGVVISTFDRSQIVAAYRPNERWLRKA